MKGIPEPCDALSRQYNNAFVYLMLPPMIGTNNLEGVYDHIMNTVMVFREAVVEKEREERKLT